MIQINTPRLDAELEHDIRSRVNPQYSHMRGTESYERRLLLGEIDRLRARIASAPVALMDTRDALGICAPDEDAFPALYALQGKRVRLVLDEVPTKK